MSFTPASAAADDPTFVMLKFSNDTRYQNIDSASLLSDLVIEGLLANGKFNIVESAPVDEDIEKLLYDEKAGVIAKVESSMNAGNFNALFEGAGFDPKYAESISTAKVGQIISPEITSAIGKNNGAKYLIHGTIINMGYGSWVNRAENDASMLVGGLLAILGHATGHSSLSKAGLSAMHDGNKNIAVALQCDVRVIRASSGRVLWNKTFTYLSGKKVTGKNASLADVKIQSEAYASLMEISADGIVKELVADLEAGKLFAR